jgi:hypothetical protein
MSSFLSFESVGVLGADGAEIGTSGATGFGGFCFGEARGLDTFGATGGVTEVCDDSTFLFFAAWSLARYALRSSGAEAFAGGFEVGSFLAAGTEGVLFKIAGAADGVLLGTAGIFSSSYKRRNSFTLVISLDS